MIATEARSKLTEAADSLAIARANLESAKPREGTRVAGLVKEALEELDYVQEAFIAVTLADDAVGGSERHVRDWLYRLEHDGRWETVQRVEQLAERAAHEWERQRRRQTLSQPGSFATLPFEIPIAALPSAYNAVVSFPSPPPPIDMQTQTYRILIPMECRDREQARYVARRQLEEAFGL